MHVSGRFSGRISGMILTAPLADRCAVRVVIYNAHAIILGRAVVGMSY